jgi:ribosome biogenesis protein NSA1
MTRARVNCTGGRAWVSNATGHIESYDFAAGKMQCVIKGIAGSVRSLQLHPTEPLIASVGLDRFLRVHCTETRKLLSKVHLKQQLTGLCWLPLKSVEQQEGELRRQQQEQQQQQGVNTGDAAAAGQGRAGEAGVKRKGSKGSKWGKGKTSKKPKQ